LIDTICAQFGALVTTGILMDTTAPPLLADLLLEDVVLNEILTKKK